MLEKKEKLPSSTGISWQRTDLKHKPNILNSILPQTSYSLGFVSLRRWQSTNKIPTSLDVKGQRWISQRKLMGLRALKGPPVIFSKSILATKKKRKEKLT